MRAVQDTEELEETDTEITLGMRSLLGVFFGLVLICGVFFGLGYSLGRGSSAPKQASHTSPANDSAAVAPKPATRIPIATPVNEDDASENSTYTPGPDAQEPVSPSAKPISLPKPSADVSKQLATLPERVAPSVPVKENTAATSSTTPSAPASSSAAASAPSMVQIAAISRKEDADVLVAALKKHGYNAIVREDPKDNLLHVQIGPFATRDEARAMRAKLLADGYNAILK